MRFDSWAEFLAMDGHGLYVWLAYGAGLLVLLYNLIAPRLQYRKNSAQVLRQLKREQAEKARAENIAMSKRVLRQTSE